MDQRLLRNGTIVALFSIGITLGAVMTAAAPVWDGVVQTRDGVPTVVNPKQPADGNMELKLEELWRIGGDEDAEYLFGVLTQIATDEQGNVYLLDTQLNEVLVFSANGEYIRSIGREGDGPGEFRRPSDLFFTTAGEVAVMQRMPGKVVLLTQDGTPLGNLPVPEAEGGGMQMFSAGRLAGSKVVLSTQSFSRRGEDASFTTKAALIGVDAEGKQVATYHSQETTRSIANMEIDERTVGNNALIWNVGSDGRVYTSSEFDAYRYTVWSPDGQKERVVETAYESRQRSAEEKERNTPRIMFRRNNQTVRPKVKTSDTDRDIQAIHVRPGGDVWILSSRGAFDVAGGVIATFDQYDGEGRFVRQMTLRGEGTYRDDGFHIVGDRLYVVTDLRSAQRAMFGGDEDEQEEDVEPMQVICYRLGPAEHTQK